MLGRDKGYYRMLGSKKMDFLEFLQSIKEKSTNNNVNAPFGV